MCSTSFGTATLLGAALCDAVPAAVACGETAPTYTDPTLTTGATFIKTVHITELRTAVVALE